MSTVTVKPNPRNSPDPTVQRETEGEKVLKALEPRDFVVVLDERGKEVRRIVRGPHWSPHKYATACAAGSDHRYCQGLSMHRSLRPPNSLQWPPSSF